MNESGSRVVPCGRPAGHDEANGRFSQFLRTPLKCEADFLCGTVTKSGGICPECVCRDFVVRSFVAASNFYNLNGTRAVRVAETRLNTINPQNPRS